MGIYWDLLGYMLGSIDFQNLRWFWWTFHWGISQMSSFVRKAQIPHKPHNNFAQHKLILTYGNIMEYIDMRKLFLGFAGLLACWLPSSNQARQWNISMDGFPMKTSVYKGFPLATIDHRRISPCHYPYIPISWLVECHQIKLCLFCLLSLLYLRLNPDRVPISTYLFGTPGVPQIRPSCVNGSCSCIAATGHVRPAQHREELICIHGMCIHCITLYISYSICYIVSYTY